MKFYNMQLIQEQMIIITRHNVSFLEPGGELHCQVEHRMQ